MSWRATTLWSATLPPPAAMSWTATVPRHMMLQQTAQILLKTTTRPRPPMCAATGRPYDASGRIEVAISTPASV